VANSAHPRGDAVVAGSPALEAADVAVDDGVDASPHETTSEPSRRVDGVRTLPARPGRLCETGSDRALLRLRYRVAGPGVSGSPHCLRRRRCYRLPGHESAQYGYTLVAPKEHQEQVAGDFTVEEYLGLQRVVHRVAEAVRVEVGAERVYILSLGSNQGNSHVHWHVVPLPPGTPYEEQQFAALMLETAGALKIPDRENAALAARIGQRMEGS
jgi:diadenosine tetraphosphate (Ap4A) HIT family hydrolase